MTLPTFLVLGAGKCGTTSINHYLKQPQVYMSPVAEPQYFAFGDKPFDFCGPGDIRVKKRIPANIAAYEALFDGARQETAVGEVSTANIYVPRACERIRHYLPNAKLIAMLRHPADRAYSDYLHKTVAGDDPCRSFRGALDDEARRIRAKWSYRFHYLQRGFYYSQLKAYLDLFDRSQVKIILFEEFSANPNNTMTEIFQFIGVDDSVVLPELRVHNAAPRIPRFLPVREGLRLRGWLKPILKYLPTSKLRQALRDQYSSKPALQPGLRDEIVKLYEADILKLQDLISVDLGRWLQRS